MSIYGADVGTVLVPATTTATYSPGYALCGLQTVSVFRDVTIPQGLFNYFMFGSRSGNTAAVTGYFFNTPPTTSTITGGSAFSLAVADMTKLAFAPVVITPAVPQNGSCAVADASIIRSVRNGDNPQTQNLYVALVANATVTPGSTTDIFYGIGVSQD